MVISLVVSYLLIEVVTYVVGVSYLCVVWNIFAKSHNIGITEYLDFISKYLDTMPDIQWYVVVVRVLFMPAWYIPRLIKLNKDVENEYLNQSK